MYAGYVPQEGERGKRGAVGRTHLCIEYIHVIICISFCMQTTSNFISISDCFYSLMSCFFNSNFLKNIMPFPNS